MTEPLILAFTLNGVRTLKMNNPKKLNGWTREMVDVLFAAIDEASADDEIGALVLTSTDPYYSAGVNLSAAFEIGHPRALYDMIVEQNQALFDKFIDFDKPILIAVNGPAIGATVTSATLCDAIIASDKATFSTPFAKLGVTPEGCSSVHLPRMIGEDAARRMLYAEGWKPSATEALEIGLVTEVVPHESLVERAQAIAEGWIAEGRTRTFPAGSERDELKAINARESRELADAFLGAPFLMGQYRFLKSRKKWGPALTFLGLRLTRPLWSRLL